MSTIVLASFLPAFFDTHSLRKLFSDVGKIEECKISQFDTLLRPNGFIKFGDAQTARQAAAKKDQIIIERSAIRVYVVWNVQETLSTIKVSGLPKNVDVSDLKHFFSSIGNIINVGVNEQTETMDIYISYSRIEFAIRAVKKLNGVNFGPSNTQLWVQFVNNESLNFNHKRDSFEYVYCRNCPWNNNLTNGNLLPSSPSPSLSSSSPSSSPQLSPPQKLLTHLRNNEPATQMNYVVSPSKNLNIAFNNVQSIPVPTYPLYFDYLSLVPPVLPTSTVYNYSWPESNDVTNCLLFNSDKHLIVEKKLTSLEIPCPQSSTYENSIPNSLPRVDKKKGSSLSTSSSSSTSISIWTKQQQEFGNALYSILERKYPKRAGKLVGMILIENQTDGIKDLITNSHKLNEKIAWFNKILDDIDYPY